MSEPVTIKFGKHQGKTLDLVPTPYLDWLTGDNDDGSPRCQSKWFYGQLTAEIARRTGGDAEPPPEHRGPIREAVRVHPNAPAGSDRYMNQLRSQAETQSILAAIAQLNSKIDDILSRLGEPVAVGSDGGDDDIAF